MSFILSKPERDYAYSNLKRVLSIHAPHLVVDVNMLELEHRKLVEYTDILEVALERVNEDVI